MTRRGSRTAAPGERSGFRPPRWCLRRIAVVLKTLMVRLSVTFGEVVAGEGAGAGLARTVTVTGRYVVDVFTRPCNGRNRRGSVNREGWA